MNIWLWDLDSRVRLETKIIMDISCFLLHVLDLVPSSIHIIYIYYWGRPFRQVGRGATYLDSERVSNKVLILVAWWLLL